MSGLKQSLYAVFAVAWMIVAIPSAGNADEHWAEVRLLGASLEAITLGRDLDGDPDEIDIRLEVIEVQQEVYPGEFVTFWVFAPEGQGMTTRWSRKDSV